MNYYSFKNPESVFSIRAHSRYSRATPPKTFIVGFLTFWYVVVNDKGASPLLDFAGFYGRFTPNTIVLYAAISVIAILFAQIFHRARLARA